MTAGHTYYLWKSHRILIKEGFMIVPIFKECLKPWYLPTKQNSVRYFFRKCAYNMIFSDLGKYTYTYLSDILVRLK